MTILLCIFLNKMFSKWANISFTISKWGYLESDFEGSLDQAVKRFEATLLRKLYPAYPSSRQLAKRLGLSHTAVANKLRDYGINRKTVKV